MTRLRPSTTNSQAVTPRLPDTLSLRWCTHCARTDRWMPLKDKHYTYYGKLCPGIVFVARYRLDRRNP